MRLRFSFLVLALSAPGCLGNFDPALYQQGPQRLALGEECGMAGRVTVPTLARTQPDDPSVSFSGSFTIDTRGLRNDVVDDVTLCTGRAQPGNDGFLRVHMNGGERWHFHIRHPDNAMSPSIYVLDEGCDARTCAVGAGLDLCGASADEHFTFVAPGMIARDYFVGIDADGLGTDGLGGFVAQLDIIHPVCGNGTREHSEGCDPGPDVPGDTCDALCRVEVSDGGTEVEANDDIYAANRIVLAGAVTTVNGGLATACESDIFTFLVPPGAPMSWTIALGLQDGGCPGAAAIPLSIDLLGGPDAARMIAHVDADGTTCPMITAAALAPDTYFIRLRSVAPGVARNVPYRITLTDTTP